MKKNNVVLALNPNSEVNDGNTKKTVKAYVVGNFAIHDDLNGFYNWKITHIQTGFALPHGFAKLKNAKQFVIEITKDDSWNMKEGKFADVSGVEMEKLEKLANIFTNTYNALPLERL